MMHKTDPHNLVEIASAEELAVKLTAYDWTVCTGFKHAGYLYLCDGSGEWAVFNEKTNKQVESITFGWCNQEKALEYIRRITAGDFEYQAWESKFNATHPHGSCHHCA